MKPSLKGFLASMANRGLRVGGEDIDRTHFLEEVYPDTGWRMDYVNFVAYVGAARRYMFGRENLIAVLGNDGFRNARLREFDPEIDPKRDFQLYAIARK